MEKELIIIRAHKLMTKTGPQATTMDMVARECGISKRTLYEIFPDKQTLVSKIVDFINHSHREDFKKIFDEAENNFDALIKIYKRLRVFLQGTNLSFYEDIRRLYPAIHEAHKANEIDHIREFAKVIEGAKPQGLVVNKINSEIAALLLFSTLQNLQANDLLNEYGFDKVAVFDGAFVNFLRGIATIQGIEYIENNLMTQE